MIRLEKEKRKRKQFIIYEQLLRVRRHDNASLSANGILCPPQASHGLLLSIELQTGLAVEGVSTATGDTLLVTGEGEHGQWHGDGDVDAQLAGLDVLLEARGGGAGAGEDGGAVAVFVGVDHVDGVVEGFDVKADQDGSEDLFLVALHVGGNVGDDSGADLIEGDISIRNNCH